MTIRLPTLIATSVVRGSRQGESLTRIPAGPAAVNDFHINMVNVADEGIFLSGLRTQACLHLNRDWKVTGFCSLPSGAHNKLSVL